MLLAISFALLYFCGTCCPLSYAGAAREKACPVHSFSDPSKSTTVAPDSYGKPCKDMSKAVVTMSYGRSGSRYVAEVLDRILIGPGSHSLHKEILGTNGKKMETVNNPLSVIRRHLCKNKAVYTGFKWKPMYWDDAYMEALRWVAFHRIPVVLSHRNPIDVYLSSQKHKVLENLTSSEQVSHCSVGATACINTHLRNQLINVEIDDMITTLNQMKCHLEGTKAHLDREQVHYVEVVFESLTSQYSSNKTVVQTWRKVFEFIDPSANWDYLSMKNLVATIAPTSSTSHRDKIRNYDEVKKALQQTSFASLLN